MPAPCIPASTPGKGDAKDVYMQDYVVLNEKERIGIFEVYGLAISKDTENVRPLMAAMEFIHKHAKDLYRRQPSSTVGLLGSTFNYNRKRFLAPTALIDGAVLPMSLSLHLSYHSP